MISPRWSLHLALSALCFNTLLSQVSALTIEYCSSLNTASTSKNSSVFQSNGLCHNFCQDSYAFAVLQYDGCWCSNYAPGTTTTGCDTQCPGYPPDYCGGTNLYGYIALSLAPSGTEGASSTAIPSTSAAAQVTVTATPEFVTVVFTHTSSSEGSTNQDSFCYISTSVIEGDADGLQSSTSSTVRTTSSSPASQSSSTWTPTPVTSLETVTGQIRTVTVTPTVPPTSGGSTAITKDNKSGGGLSTGAAVGLTIGLVALVAIISAIIYFCIRKRNQEKAEEYDDMDRRGSSAGIGSLGGPVPSRTMSENSRFVLGTDGRQVIESWEAGDEPGSRRSRLMPVDPRLDPFAPVYQRGENKSRESVNTIRDEHDYSRRVAGHPQGPILRATNPDDPDE
ncbi:hypothetical protein BDZ45DRAFT_602639 [Acephala macrosclerotiorum]|nr:hypothetical protein BDZ45DRAFT_602639 [Acephala macrosclerotiorum]